MSLRTGESLLTPLPFAPKARTLYTFPDPLLAGGIDGALVGALEGALEGALVGGAFLVLLVVLAKFVDDVVFFLLVVVVASMCWTTHKTTQMHTKSLKQ